MAPVDPVLTRLEDEFDAAQAAVKEHLSTAVRVWYGSAPPPGPRPVPITDEWLARHDELKATRDQAHEALLNYLRRPR
jgi:hypothetical protein